VTTGTTTFGVGFPASRGCGIPLFICIKHGALCRRRNAYCCVSRRAFLCVVCIIPRVTYRWTVQQELSLTQNIHEVSYRR
jgi:hypothetical protein